MCFLFEIEKRIVREAMVITTVYVICEIERKRTTEQRFKPISRAVRWFNELSQGHFKENHIC